MLTIHQHININFLKVEAITNSSVLQIGSSGTIQALSKTYNTGGFTEPAEEVPLPNNATPEVPIPVLPFTS